MYEIKLKVNGNGTIQSEQVGVLHLAATGSKNCVKLKFEVDDSIEGRYQYVKFYHPQSTVLQRVNNNEVVVSTNVLVKTGIWLLSFLSSNAGISPYAANGSYVFSSKPIECHVCEGLLNINIETENVRRIEELENQLADVTDFAKDVVEMNLDTIDIPEGVTKIGNYFMYNNSVSIQRLKIPSTVKSIGGYCFYGSRIESIEFADDSQLEKFENYAFSHVNTEVIEIPPSLSDFGHYAFQGGTVECIRFVGDSQIRTLAANSFNNITAFQISLPYGMTKFATNGYVIRNCRIEHLWIPASITTAIPQSAFFEASGIKNIWLDEGFAVSANFSNCTGLTHDSLVTMFEDLPDRTGLPTLTITIGATNLAKLTAEEIAWATNKNWTIS